MPENINKSLGEWLEDEARPFKARFESTDSDGIILPWVRALFGMYFLHSFHDRFVRWYLRRHLPEVMSLLQAQGYGRRARDMYGVLMLGVVFFCYAFIFVAIKVDCGMTYVCLVIAILVLSCRLLEICSVLIALHLSGREFTTDSPMRAVVLTLMNYAEVVIAFAAFFTIESYLFRDPFRGLLDSVVNPLYFSVLTIATVGYGDYSPETDAGKILVVLEVVVGLLLLVVILQRTVAISLTTNTDKTDDRTTITVKEEVANPLKRGPSDVSDSR